MDKKYVVYQHVTPDNMYYFGQTNNIKQRWSGNGRLYKGTALQPYIEKFGWNNIQHIVLFKDQTRENALWIENFLIETAREDGVCINKQRSGNIRKEEGYDKKYYEENKEQIRKQQKQYYEQNKQQSRQRYQKNRDKINEQRRQRYQKNRDKINEQRRQLYQRKKQEKQFKEFGCLPLW